MQQHPMPQPPWLMSGQSGLVTYPSQWVPSSQFGDVSNASPGNPESAARASQRHKRNQEDDDRAGERKKPHRIRVKSGGEIDGGCDGKNAWDDAVRRYVPKMIDISIIDWDEHKPETLKKLRDTLEGEFEYIDHPLNAQGFRNAIKGFLKTERSRLKSRFLAGKDNYLLHIQPKTWEKLKTYWMTDFQ
jgi:hypothetical protein